MPHRTTTESITTISAPVRRGRALLAVADSSLAASVTATLTACGYRVERETTEIGPAFALIVADRSWMTNPLRSHSRDEHSGTPLLVLLSQRDESAVTSALRAGADEILFVPEDLGRLEQRLALLEARAKHRTGAHKVDTAKMESLLSATERHARELELLHRVRTAIEVEVELEKLFRTIVEQVGETFGYSHVSLYMLDSEGTLLLQHQIGYDTVLERIPPGIGVAGRVARTGEYALIENVAEEPEFLAAIPGLSSEICVPFFRGDRVAGIFNIESEGERRLTQDDLRVMVELTGFLNLAVERSDLLSAIQGSEQRLRYAMDAAGMGTWLWRPQENFVQWSEQMGPLYGLPYGTPSLTSEQWFNLVHPDDRELIRRADIQILRYGTDYEVEFRVILPSGAVRWLEGKGRVVERDSHHNSVAIVGVTIDITGRKRLEEERLRLVHIEAERARAEAAQRSITDTLERMTAAFLAVDRSWNFTYLNQRALVMFNLAGQEMIGHSIWTAFPLLEGSPIESLLRSAVEHQSTTTFDAQWPGLNRWVEAHAYPSADGLSIYLQDVTERKRAEEEQQRTEVRFRSLVQNASDIILILDRDGTVRYASPAIERVIGQRPEEVVGNDNFFRVHPQDAKRLRRAFVRVAKTPGVSDPILLRFRHRDGGYRWLEVTATNLFDDPTIQGIVANCRDVTDRHEAEYNLWFLAETSAMLGTSLDLETTLSSVSRLVVMNLADMCIVDVVNDQGEAEAFSVSHRDAVAERRLQEFRTAWPLSLDSDHGPGFVLRTGKSVLHETIEDESQQLWMNVSDGRFDVASFGFRSAIIVPLIARGSITGVVTIASVTPGRFHHPELVLVEELARRAALAVDNARLYRAARSAVEARDQFLSVAAHELRTPITAITGFAALLERELAMRNDPGRIQRFVRRLGDAGSRLSLLVDDMLDVSRIRLGQLPLRVAEVDLTELVKRVENGYEEQDPAAIHHFVLEAPNHPCVVPADEDRLEQVLSNVIDNAVKYSPGGGDIIIRLLGDADGYLLQISDSGMGLPFADIESVFRPFGRASNAAHSNLPGLGIGLYICKNIVERHGGRIWAESEGEGRGTTISIWLPTAPPHGDFADLD